MGQYHLIVNPDKKQFLTPTRLGDGLKLLEFGDGGATLTALAILLAQDNGRGLGDLHVAMPDTPLESWEQGKCGLKRVRTPHAYLVGSWAGDRITIAGDYGDNLPGENENLYYYARRVFKDISVPMRELICQTSTATPAAPGGTPIGLGPSGCTPKGRRPERKGLRRPAGVDCALENGVLHVMLDWFTGRRHRSSYTA